MNISQSLFQGQKLGQQLNLAPQLLNWLQLLQAPTQELSTMIRHELETNPALEFDDPSHESLDEVFSGEEFVAEFDLQGEDARFDNGNINERLETLAEIDQEWRDDYAQNKGASASLSEDAEKHQYVLDSLVYSESLYAHLHKQLGAFELSKSEFDRAELIIGSLNSRGFLAASLVDLAEQCGAPLEDMQRALGIVQQLSPAGIGARDLRECLMLQIEDRTSVAYRLVDECFDLMTDRQWNAAADRMDVEREDVDDAMAEIRALDPEPGLKIEAEPAAYIEPDLVIRRENGAWTVELNDDQIPHLRISPAIRSLLEQRTLSPEDVAYIRQKIRGGQFLIRGIHQRKETLLRVAKEILRVQNEYFDREEGEMAPLTMNKVAAIIGVHETTVSRAIANKYISTPKGVMPMKQFFKGGYQCDDGSSLTPDKVKDLIDDMIHREEPSSPLTDLDISRELKGRGLNVARRTVAKYREELNILSSKERSSKCRPVAVRPVAMMAVA